MAGTRKAFPAMAIAVITFALAGQAMAQSGGGFEIRKFTLAPGGPVSGGSFTLNNASGQHDAAVHTGGSFDLYGGFFGPATPAPMPTSTPSAVPTTTPTATAFPTMTPAPCCMGDADNSGGAVNANDFLSVQGNFGLDNGFDGLGDANCSGGAVNANDFLAVQANFGLNCGP